MQEDWQPGDLLRTTGIAVYDWDRQHYTVRIPKGTCCLALGVTYAGVHEPCITILINGVIRQMVTDLLEFVQPGPDSQKEQDDV